MPAVQDGCHLRKQIIGVLTQRGLSYETTSVANSVPLRVWYLLSMLYYTTTWLQTGELGC